ncbi:phosphotransferase [Frateuria sp. Soil773]|uniref:CehA/McbA family metallohydrolase n=1 Tax=Frateuria sp. Soil773 TaxID=1736407 RepID=UPI0006FB1C35|nr:CehA/McbA family metallohydrolase [Frateuria sp. Soil773]KRF02175.1 phosphotransferase [Frateuria sp. Soil773]
MNLRARHLLIQWLAGLILLLAAVGTPHAAVAPAQDGSPDLVLRGELDGRDNLTYRTLPFDVPAGTSRITVQFDYGGHEDERTTVDLGLLGPDGFRGQDGFRGWSGGSKALFTVSATDATPSYLPGAIRPGRWSLLLGIPNIRAGSRSRYTARLWFGRPDDPAWEPAVLNPPLRDRAGWYRGDLHMHTAHSDGSCASQSGRRVPCPLFFTAEGAARRGLDFIAITDHNTVAHADAMRELQPYFDRLLLIPGREITTFSGHANLFGTTAPVDFRVGSREVPDWNHLLRALAPLRGLVSINHAIRPSGEACMGCGWTADPPADMALVQAVEIVNGSDAGTPLSAVGFWERQLARGHRLTAIGGSDNHDAFQSVPRIGSDPTGVPTTVVHAQALSMPAILDGIRAGHVFVDVEGSRDRMLELAARNGAGQAAGMGDAIEVAAGEPVRFEAHVQHVAGARLVVLLDGRAYAPMADAPIAGDDRRLRFDWTGDGQRHWLRAEVRDAHGRPLLIGNPIYLEPARR